MQGHGGVAERELGNAGTWKQNCRVVPLLMNAKLPKRSRVQAMVVVSSSRSGRRRLDSAVVTLAGVRNRDSATLDAAERERPAVDLRRCRCRDSGWRAPCRDGRPLGSEIDSTVPPRTSLRCRRCDWRCRGRPRRRTGTARAATKDADPAGRIGRRGRRQHAGELATERAAVLIDRRRRSGRGVRSGRRRCWRPKRRRAETPEIHAQSKILGVLIPASETHGLPGNPRRLDLSVCCEVEVAGQMTSVAPTAATGHGLRSEGGGSDWRGRSSGQGTGSPEHPFRPGNSIPHT